MSDMLREQIAWELGEHSVWNVRSCVCGWEGTVGATFSEYLDQWMLHVADAVLAVLAENTEYDQVKGWAHFFDPSWETAVIVPGDTAIKMALTHEPQPVYVKREDVRSGLTEPNRTCPTCGNTADQYERRMSEAPTVYSDPCPDPWHGLPERREGT